MYSKQFSEALTDFFDKESSGRMYLEQSGPILEQAQIWEDGADVLESAAESCEEQLIVFQIQAHAQAMRELGTAMAQS